MATAARSWASRVLDTTWLTGVIVQFSRVELGNNLEPAVNEVSLFGRREPLGPMTWSHLVASEDDMS
jgi:hypothetical protein